MDYLESFAESLTIFVDNNASIICFLNGNARPDNATLYHTAVIPPALKIQRSIVSYCSDPTSRFAHPPNSFPGMMEYMGLDINERADSLFIELLPGRERPGEVAIMARDILLLTPLLYRYRLAKDSSSVRNNTDEWHYLLLKALATAKSNPSSPFEDDRKGGVEDKVATAWTKYLQQAVLDLMFSRSAMESFPHSVEDDEVEMWMKNVQERRCPALHQLMASLLSADTPARGAKASPLVRLHGNSIQISLSPFTDSGGDGGDNPKRHAEYSVACLVHLIHAAAVHPSVLSISVGTAYNFANFDAVAMSQSGTAYKQPFSAAGLTGRHQICGVADTGLDGK
jgi:hypothetical protein